ncbi:ISAs1 family transposase [Persicitalea sp.]|uniref:ISAs1 family transposase n=1 Tax=Persicitalea sp. TaxID=3100273 RepID=UPI0035937D80
MPRVPGGRTREKTAIPQLIGSLDLKGSLVSVDAIACQLSNADLIVEKEGHYPLALKKKNKGVHEQVSQRMQAKKAGLPSAEHVDFGSGRIERRRCYVESDLSLYDDLAGWEHLGSIVMVEASREIGDKTSSETRYCLSDLVLAPDEFNGLVRGHRRAAPFVAPPVRYALFGHRPCPGPTTHLRYRW